MPYGKYWCGFAKSPHLALGYSDDNEMGEMWQFETSISRDGKELFKTSKSKFSWRDPERKRGPVLFSVKVLKRNSEECYFSINPGF
jgi:hypothetical protein